MQDKAPESNREKCFSPSSLLGEMALPERELQAFDRWMDESLDELVERWVDLAAPAAALHERHSAGRDSLPAA